MIPRRDDAECDICTRTGRGIKTYRIVTDHGDTPAYTTRCVLHAPVMSARKPHDTSA